MPTKHAILSASSSYRWLNCPPSARLSEAYEDKSSEYAAEGMLRLMKSEQERNKEQFGEEYSNTDNYVFVKPDGTPYKANYLTKQLEAFCKKHPEFPRISAHSLRTSCATWLVNEQGWTPLEAAAHLRHKNDDITKQYYIKTDSEDYRKKIGKKANCITI